MEKKTINLKFMDLGLVIAWSMACKSTNQGKKKY